MKALLVAAGIAAVLGSSRQALSPADIATAIEQGRAGNTLQKKCTARGENGFDITIEGPIGRVMRAAREAARKKQDFTAADVTDVMAAPRLTVTAARYLPLQKQTMEAAKDGPSINYRGSLVLKSRPPRSEQAIVLHPVSGIAYDHRNRPGILGSGGVLTSSPLPLPGSDLAASFDLAEFRAIPHRDVDVVVFMTDAGSHSCRIRWKDRDTLK